MHVCLGDFYNSLDLAPELYAPLVVAVDVDQRQRAGMPYYVYMKELRSNLKNDLQSIFSERVCFEKTERTLYGHDIASIPKLIKPIIGDTTPEAIVQPKTEEEVVRLVRWANHHGIALTPRGKATSGYGGVLPVRKGVVVDLWHMKAVLQVDEDSHTVTTQPGISWEQLDEKLLKHGLTLRLYPTSYPSSTVGGWLAQGGGGIGSYEFGYFRENVLSACVVLPDGEVREFAGEDLALISDAEGITGIITQVSLRVQPAEELEVLAVAADIPRKFQALLEALHRAKLPLWSLGFIDPTMAQLKNQAPRREHFGVFEEPPQLPPVYTVILAYKSKDAIPIRKALPDLTAASGAVMLNAGIAQHEWENRFKIMTIKRLGPSLVPAEVIVPLDRMAAFLEKTRQQIAQPVAMEGVVVANARGDKPEVVVLGFVPADERKFKYNVAFGLTLLVTKIAESVGGRAYSTGIYFSSKAESVLGSARTSKLRSFKQQVDPQHLLNPRKVIDTAAVAKLINLAGYFTPLIRAACNRIDTEIGERFDHERNRTGAGISLGSAEDAVRDVPADVAWYAYSCSQCGYCVNECDQFYGRGWESQSPRGKWFWLREYMDGRAQWNQKMIDSILSCTTCELCNFRCSSALPIEPAWMKLRGMLINGKKKMTFPAFEMMAAALEGQGDVWAGYRNNRTDWFPRDLWQRHGPGTQAKHVYFAGCTASYVEHDIGIGTVRLLDAAGVEFGYLGQGESCCGVPMLCAGKWDLFEKIMKSNIDAVKQAGADTVITSCPACDIMWRQYYPRWANKLGIEFNLKTKHYSEIAAEKLKDRGLSFPARAARGKGAGTGSADKAVKVTWHDSCHIGRASGVYEAPRTLIKAIPGTELVEMEFNREKAHCCGSVLSLMKEPKVAADIGEARLDEALDTGAQKILALCPCCEFQFRVTANKTNAPIEVQDLAHFAAEQLGYDLPDPHPEVRSQWAVFEAMIALMTPEGFADLMKTMLPEMVAAMPAGMGKLMRGLGKVPGVLDAVKPTFPVLFPRLLPMMMPKLMPVLLKRVSERVPMPAYMEEQMPVLMPQVMDNLMPHMIGEVVPLVSQPLVDYLQGRNGAATSGRSKDVRP